MRRSKTSVVDLGGLSPLSPEKLIQRAITSPMDFGRLSTPIARKAVEKRILHDDTAFKKTVTELPTWTLGSREMYLKDPARRARCDTEFGPDIDSSRMDWAKPSSPKYTVQGRPKAEQVKGADVPGPGHYTQMSTMHKSHPTLPVPGKGLSACWGTEVRKSFDVGDPDAPCPLKYKPMWSQTTTRDSIPDITGRSQSQTIPGRGGIWATSPITSEEDKSTIYDITGQGRKGGVAVTPMWTMTNRPASCFIPKGDPTPAPGTNTPAVSSYGRIKRSPCYGFGSSSRFGKDGEPRPY